jgi:vacuolar-type H+-ATPase subunit F/Vma7
MKNVYIRNRLQCNPISAVLSLIPQSLLVILSEGTMSRKILTFGYDACHRWAVLRLAGFTIHVCESISELRDQLMKRPDVDAVLMVEDIVSVPQEAITAARSYFSGPLVLFEAHVQAKNREQFNLRVPILSGPSAWLPQIEALIKNHQQPASEAAIQDAPTKSAPR